MAEYIDRDILFEQIRLTANRSCLGETSVAEISAMEIVNVIANIPAADVKPVQYGEWAGTVCCCCGESTVNYYDCDYCPNCGAKMDGERNMNNGEL